MSQEVLQMMRLDSRLISRIIGRTAVFVFLVTSTVLIVVMIGGLIAPNLTTRTLKLAGTLGVPYLGLIWFSAFVASIVVIRVHGKLQAGVGIGGEHANAPKELPIHESAMEATMRMRRRLVNLLLCIGSLVLLIALPFRNLFMVEVADGARREGFVVASYVMLLLFGSLAIVFGWRAMRKGG